MADLSCWIIIQCLNPESPLNFTFKAILPFIDKGFHTLNDYPGNKISHVMIVFINNHLQLSKHVKKC